VHSLVKIVITELQCTEWRISNSNNDYSNQTLGSTSWKGISLSGAGNQVCGLL